MGNLVTRYPRAIIVIVGLLTAFFVFGLRRGLVLDVSPLGFVERGSQAKADFEAARKDFGPDDYLVVAVVCDDVFTPDNLARLRALHENFVRLSGIMEVLSLVNVPYVHSVDGVVAVDSLLPKSSAAGRQIMEARAVATSDGLYVGNLVSPDARTAAFNILFKPEVPTHTRHQITKRIYDLARNTGFSATYFAGDPFTQWRSTEAIKSDLKVFLPLTMVFIALLLRLCFKSFVAVVLPFGAIGIGLVWLIGLMAYLNAHFTVLGLMLPTLMLAIGCSYMIHVINQIGIAECGNIQSNNPPSAIKSSAASIKAAMEFINLPVAVSALTIIAGFLSLAFTRIPAIRSTAIYAAVGAAFTMILSLTFIPAALMLLPRRLMTVQIGLGGKMVRLLESTGRWATAHQTLLYILTGMIVVASVIGIWRIKIDIDYFHFFKPNAETSIGLVEISERLSGAVNFEIIVEGKSAEAIENYSALSRIAALQQLAEGSESDENGGGVKGIAGIDNTLSVVDLIKHLNRAFHDNDPRFYSIPSDKSTIRELLSDRDHLRSFLSQDGRTARILVRSNLTASRAMADAIHELETRGRELLPEFRVFATGTFVLLNRTSDQIAGEQKQSVTIALVAIYLMISLLFRSLRMGLTAIIPNLIPVLFFFGFMGWCGIELNLTTSLVASVVLGLAVDNSVQFLVRFRCLQPQTANLRDAIIQSMRLSGRPIIYANIALAAAFAIFSISNFEPIGSFGLLSAVTIVGCLIEDLILLPARLTSPVFRAK